jgi:hypothetical protein
LRYALYPILMGSLGWWAAFSVMPLAVQWELPLAIVDRIPVFGFCLGIALGIAAGRWEPVRDAIWVALAATVMGWLVWLFVVMIASLGVSLAFENEAFDRAMEPVNTVATWLGCIVAGGAIAVGACAALYGNLGALLDRFRPKRRNERG